MLPYQNMKRSELERIAKERGIKYLVYLDKPKLIKMIEANDKDPTYTVNHEAKAKMFAAFDKWRHNPDNRQKFLQFHMKYNHRARGLPKRLPQEVTTS